MEITVNCEVLEEKIQKLRTLKSTCEAIDVTAEALSGSGATIDIIQLVDQEYPLLKSTIETLLTNSISFFENIKASMSKADTGAADKLN